MSDERHAGDLWRPLRDRIAVVTGAGNGIGRGIAEVLADRGAAIAVVDLSREAAVTTVERITASGGIAAAYEADVGEAGSIAGAVQEAIGELGRVDICVANAGVIGGSGFEEREWFSDEDWDATYRVNVRGLVNTAMAVVEHLKAREAGRIVNIASHAGRTPAASAVSPGSTMAPYGVSKAAAIQWTWHLALQLARHNITVNAVCPGTLWTGMWERIARSRRESDPSLQGMSTREVFDHFVKARTPLGRGQTPHDIGKAVAFLASDDARVITGQALNVNGGAVMN